MRESPRKSHKIFGGNTSYLREIARRQEEKERKKNHLLCSAILPGFQQQAGLDK
jgi:hypothetical protein